jgi:hypothetical protein
MKLKMTNEITVTTNNIHGFEVIRTVERLVKNPKTKIEKLKKVDETWYYPRLDQALNKVIQLDAELALNLDDLIERLKTLNSSIDNLKSIFSKSGKIFQTT